MTILYIQSTHMFTEFFVSRCKISIFSSTKCHVFHDVTTFGS